MKIVTDCTKLYIRQNQANTTSGWLHYQCINSVLLKLLYLELVLRDVFSGLYCRFKWWFHGIVKDVVLATNVTDYLTVDSHTIKTQILAECYVCGHDIFTARHCFAITRATWHAANSLYNIVESYLAFCIRKS